MSFNRLKYDECQYKQVLAETTGSGEYLLSTPQISTCHPCYQANPSIRFQKNGNLNEPTKKDLIDIDSELLNIKRRESKCPSQKFTASCNNDGGSSSSLLRPNTESCFMQVEETRTSNPPSNLRGTGWNRFQYLCQNPQQNCIPPFDMNIQNRIIVKDNHRPCIPTPIDPTLALPPQHSYSCQSTVTTCAVPTTNSR